MAGDQIDFFVSHAGVDRAWAEWVAWQLREAGYTVELDVWDWAAGRNFVTAMSDALERAGRVVALFSSAYFDRSRYTTEEWTSALLHTPGVGEGALVPVRVEEVPAEKVPTVLRSLVYRDVFGMSEEKARRALLEAVTGSARPGSRPVFPGMTEDRRDGSGPRRPGTMPRVWNVPARNLQFTGRDRLLVAVREALLAGDRAVVQALHGLSGVGKTQLVIEYAHRFAGDYDLVWWLDADLSALLGPQIAQLAEELGCAEPQAGIEAKQRAVLAELRQRNRWLLVFVIASQPHYLTALLPGGTGHVLVTSRTHAWLEAAVPVEVDVLARAESIAILVNWMPGLPGAEADRLAHALGDLPLALAQAAAYMQDTGTPVWEYLDLFAARAAHVLDRGQPASHPQSLAAATQLAFDRLRDDDPAAAQVVAICSFLPPERVPAEWFPRIAAALPADLASEATDPVAWRQVLSKVNRHALARVDQHGLQMHRPVQAIVRGYLPPDQVAVAQALAAELLTTDYPDDEKLPVVPRASGSAAHRDYNTAGIYRSPQRASVRPVPGPGTAVPGRRMTITMLGVPGSGKSTYILGMYAELVRGIDGCFLHLPDPDSAIELIGALQALWSGDLPEPTAERPVPHEFIFTMAGFTERTEIDLADFRGGAAFDLIDGRGSDTAQLRRRLADSDSIFVVLDSAHFLEPVTPGRLQVAREATAADLFAHLITNVLADRERAGRPVPSIAILLTKADLIDGRQGSVARDWTELASEIRMLVRPVFQPQIDARIFPVSVLDIDASPDRRRLAAAMELHGVADPLIFAAGQFLKTCQSGIHQQRQQTLARRQDAVRRLDELTNRGQIVKRLTRSHITATQAEISEADTHIAELNTQWNDLAHNSQVLLSILQARDLDK